jgi:hypothetical protein
MTYKRTDVSHPAAIEPVEGETVFMKKMRLLLQRRFNVRLFRNNVGRAWTGESVPVVAGILIKRPYQIAFGLAPGSHDVIGVSSVIVTPDMVGKRIGVFTSIETKGQHARTTEAQLNWRSMVLSMGGIAGIVRDYGSSVELLTSSGVEINPAAEKDDGSDAT